MSDRQIGVVIPTRWEAGAIFARHRFRRTGHRLYQTTLNGNRVDLCLSGVGREAARRAAYRLCGGGAKELVSMGFCGALVPGLQVGQLVTDRIATVDQPLCTRAQRQELAQKLNAVAADMETQAVIEAGTRRGVPIRVLRVVSDTVDDDLTPLFGSSGRFSIPRIVFSLLNPRTWPLAARLRRQSLLARESLAAALDRPL